MINNNITKILDYINKNTLFQRYLANQTLSSEYYYNSLTLCVIDAIFSIGVKYESVKNVIDRYCQYFGIQKLRQNVNIYPSTQSQEKITDLIDRYEKLGEEFMRKHVYCNNQRTSTTNGFTKAQAVLEFCRVLNSYNVEYFQDLQNIVNNPDFDEEIKKIPGQKSGISLSYFFMLAGDDQLIKPDRMIIRFLIETTGIEYTPHDAALIIKKLCQHLSSHYPSMTPRLLDHVIWNYMRNQSNV